MTFSPTAFPSISCVIIEDTITSNHTMIFSKGFVYNNVSLVPSLPSKIKKFGLKRKQNKTKKPKKKTNQTFHRKSFFTWFNKLVWNILWAWILGLFLLSWDEIRHFLFVYFNCGTRLLTKLWFRAGNHTRL